MNKRIAGERIIHGQPADGRELAIQAAGVGIWDWDIITDTMTWDDTMFTLYGIPPQLFNNSCRDWELALHPGDKMSQIKELQMALAGEKEFDTSFRILWPDGSVRYIRGIGFIQRGPDGQAVRMVGTNWDVTEKHVVIQALTDANKELSKFFNVIDEVFFSVDMVNLKVIQISNACESLYGYKASDFLANHLLWFDLIHPDDKHLIANEDSLLQRNQTINNQYRIIRKDNVVRSVETTIIPTLDKTGRLIRVDGVTRDITERKKAEAELKLSEERYRRIVETSQEGIWTIDEHNKTNFVNKKICEILEYPAEELMGRELFDLMLPEDIQQTVEGLERRRLGIKENNDIRFVTKSGRHVWTNISASPIFDEDGEYKGSLAMVTDITRRKNDEEELKTSEANLRTVFDYTDSAYILINADLKIVSFNVLAQKYSEQYNGTDLEAGKHVRNYFSGERWDIVKNALGRASQGETVRYELNYTQPDGSVKWFSIRWLGVKSTDNKNVGFILANKDITQRKLAALEREKIIADLIQRNKDLEQFTFIISHNLRAPVANIIGLADMLNDDDMEAAGREEVLRRVTSSIKNIDSVISDLNLILQAREKVDEQREMVDLKELLDAVKTSISNILLKEHVHLQCFFDGAGSVFSTRSYLYSIFYNLLSNSIKYRQPGIEPEIVIKTSRENNKLHISFMDNGKGIDLEKNGAQLFGLYKRFDTTIEGKGMGLFMVKTQVEAMGGTIEIKSQLGEGTEFLIVLPL